MVMDYNIRIVINSVTKNIEIILRNKGEILIPFMSFRHFEQLYTEYLAQMKAFLSDPETFNFLIKTNPDIKKFKKPE